MGTPYYLYILGNSLGGNPLDSIIKGVPPTFSIIKGDTPYFLYILGNSLGGTPLDSIATTRKNIVGSVRTFVF